MEMKLETNRKTSGTIPSGTPRNQEKSRSVGNPAKARGTVVDIKFSTKR